MGRGFRDRYEPDRRQRRRDQQHHLGRWHRSGAILPLTPCSSISRRAALAGDGIGRYGSAAVARRHHSPGRHGRSDPWAEVLLGLIFKPNDAAALCLRRSRKAAAHRVLIFQVRQVDRLRYGIPRYNNSGCDPADGQLHHLRRNTAIAEAAGRWAIGGRPIRARSVTSRSGCSTATPIVVAFSGDGGAPSTQHQHGICFVPLLSLSAVALRAGSIALCHASHGGGFERSDRSIVINLQCSCRPIRALGFRALTLNGIGGA